MTDVFNIIFDMFGTVIRLLKRIPITQNVSLFDFSIAILILTISALAFVSVVRVGNTGNVSSAQKLRSDARSRNSNSGR